MRGRLTGAGSRSGAPAGLAVEVEVAGAQQLELAPAEHAVGELGVVQPERVVMARRPRYCLAMHEIGGDVGLRGRRSEQHEVAVAPVRQTEVVVGQEPLEGGGPRDDRMLALDDRPVVDTAPRLPEEADGRDRRAGRRAHRGRARRASGRCRRR